MSSFKITISSRFEELWRYNIIAVCELCSAVGERIEYKSKESNIAPVGSNLSAPPVDYDSKRTIVLESGAGDFVNLLVYVIPHTLPTTSDIYKTKNFHLTVKVEADKEILLNQVFDINQWSGDNISLDRVGAKEIKE
ncbi:MAG: hypothetical protein J6V21_03115 [Alistipes sp.]|nr:hypothetical protein [Alistipes sp.]